MLRFALGAVVANFIGTTGASMVLIRPGFDEQDPDRLFTS
jgi:hypothetical protein